MKNLTLFILLFCSTQLFAQDIKKGYKQYEKENFEKAMEEIMPLHKANKFNAAASYGLALIYSAPNNAERDLYTAYTFVNAAIRDFSKLKRVYSEGIEEYMDQDKFEDKRSEIDDELYGIVKQSNDYAKLSEFLQNCPESQYYTEALSLRYKFEIETAKKENTVKAYESYITKNPYSEFLDEAKTLRNKIAFEDAKKQNTEAAFNNFITSYPKAEQKNEAIKLKGEAAYNETKSKNTVAAYNQFLSTYSESPHTKEIKELLQEATFKGVKNSNSLEGYNDFLSTAGSGKLFNDAFDLKSEQLGKKYQNVCTLPSIEPYWVKVIDDNNKNDRNTAVCSDKDGSIIVCGYSKKTDSWFNDGWLLKMNIEGKLQWKANINGNSDDMILDVATNQSGSIWISGNKDRKFRADKNFAYVCKLSPDGKKIWEKTHKGSTATAIKALKNNDAVLAGYTDQVDGNRDLWVILLDANGNVKWRKDFPKKGEPCEIEILSNGAVLVVCQYLTLKLNQTGGLIAEQSFQDNYQAYSSIKAEDGSVYITGRFYDFKKETKSDYWLMKLNSSGSKVWSKTYNRSGLHDIATSLLIKKDGNLNLYGVTSQENDEFLDDIWVAQLDKNGNLISEEVIGSKENEKRPQVTLLKDDSVLLSGSKGYPADAFFIKMKR